jgi:hypothetical protein
MLMASMCSWWTALRLLLFRLWSGSRSTHGASYFSQLRSTAHPLFQQPNPASDVRATERLIDFRAESTFLRPECSPQMLCWWAPQIRVGDTALAASRRSYSPDRRT